MSPQLDALILRAALMRAEGKSWEDIAKKVGRSAERIRHWPTIYPAEWARYFRTAEEQLLADVAVEARVFLRKHLRSDIEKTSLSAIEIALRTHVKHRELELRAQAAQPADPPLEDESLQNFVQEVRTMSDDELQQTIDDFLRERQQCDDRLFEARLPDTGPPVSFDEGRPVERQGERDPNE